MAYFASMPKPSAIPKTAVQRQLDLLATSRVRLESAVASADQEV